MSQTPSTTDRATTQPTALPIATASPSAQFDVVDRALLIESKTNHRRIGSKQADDELAESIRQVGILEPLLVRPGKEKGSFEVIAGARRLKAAKAAGLVQIPVRILDLSDSEVLEVAITENLQRLDVHPVDEADGYATLLKSAKYDVDAIAKRVAKSVGYIYQRLALRKLCPTARKFFEEDKITAAHALLLARLQPKDQENALNWAKSARFPYGEREKDDFCSARDLAGYIERKLHRDLHTAPWKKDDAGLVAEAGACTTCPKRTGFTPMLFPDIAKKDTCTDGACFAKKQAIFLMIREKELATAGPVVKIESGHSWGEDREKLHKAGVVLRDAYMDADGKKCPGTVEALVVDGNEAGHTKKICTLKRCKVHGASAGGMRPESSVSKVEVEKQKKEKEKWQLEEFVHERATLALLKSVKLPISKQIIRAAAETAAQYYDGSEGIDEFFGLKAPSDLPRVKTDLDAARILAFLAISNDLNCRGGRHALKELCKSARIDLKKIEKEILAERAAAAKKKPSPPSASKPSPKPTTKKKSKKPA